MYDGAGFFGKNPHWAKMIKNGPKTWKITSLVLSGICVKWKFLWFINILRKLHAWDLKIWPKIALDQWDLVFFNRQYSTNRLKSDFDFWHVDRHEWKKQGSVKSFLKNSHLGKWVILGPKFAHRNNSRSAGRIFLKIYTMKGANR